MFDWLKTGKATEPRKGMPSPQLDEAEFKRRFLAQFGASDLFAENVQDAILCLPPKAGALGGTSN